MQHRDKTTRPGKRSAIRLPKFMAFIQACVYSIGLKHGHDELQSLEKQHSRYLLWGPSTPAQHCSREFCTVANPEPRHIANCCWQCSLVWFDLSDLVLLLVAPVNQYSACGSAGSGAWTP